MPDHTRQAQDALIRYPTPDIAELSLGGSTPEESEEEEPEVIVEEETTMYEDSDGEPDTVAWQQHFLAGDILPRILSKIVARREEVFPWIDGEQRVNDNEFTNLMSDLRHMLLNMPVVEGSVNYYMIVREWPPIGSDFTPRGGYSTPEGIVIPKSMRDQVKAIKMGYGTEAERQKGMMERITPLSPRSPRTERGSLYETDMQRQQARFENPPRIREITRDSPAWGPPLSTNDPRYVSPAERRARRSGN